MGITFFFPCTKTCRNALFIKSFYQNASFLSLECDFSFYLYIYFWVSVAGDFCEHLMYLLFFGWVWLINHLFFKFSALCPFLLVYICYHLLMFLAKKMYISSVSQNTVYIVAFFPLTHDTVLFVPVFFLSRCFLHTSLSRSVLWTCLISIRWAEGCADGSVIVKRWKACKNIKKWSG